ncbi:ABC transporter substrate-binding protein [Pararhizobium mangrovi]|uniref:Nitrate ABC transporter substrate-binding protein n=1 Tax=Pararhizobium mangrovi TaxID=2590452 RepID=A0A506TY64_9HYPH|nr:ABC transporter substrate-binding protein [Pararhizobium mangrovi]TPW26256.1 nitrate ABC transporter substrate-binding protein [Pararhizobium mangrovi]
MKGLKLLAVTFAAGLAATTVSSIAARADDIGVSYQPSLYWALPFYYATQNGWWKKVGLTPKFSTFPSGAPQIAAGASGSWDVGGTGSVPAVLGAVRFKIETIGITNDESKTNALMATPEEYKELKADPSKLKGQRILLTTNSTVDYAARNCLEKMGLKQSDVQFVNLGQAQIITAVTSGNGSVAGVWAPNTYTLQNRAKAEYLCTGADTGAIVPGALIVTADYAKNHPEDVAKFLAIYLRGWSWAKSHMAEAKKMALAFYKQGGLETTPEAMDKEFRLRPTFDLDQQLAMLDASKGPSKVDRWFSDIGKFMASVGTLQENPDPKSYVTDRYMKMVAADPKLRSFATEFDKK